MESKCVPGLSSSVRGFDDQRTVEFECGNLLEKHFSIFGTAKWQFPFSKSPSLQAFPQEENKIGQPKVASAKMGLVHQFE